MHLVLGRLPLLSPPFFSPFPPLWVAQRARFALRENFNLSPPPKNGGRSVESAPTGGVLNR